MKSNRECFRLSFDIDPTKHNDHLKNLYEIDINNQNKEESEDNNKNLKLGRFFAKSYTNY